MGIIHKSKLSELKEQVAGKAKCRFAGGTVAELDGIIEKEIIEILRAAFLHTQSRRQVTVKPIDLRLGFNDYRAAFITEALEQLANEVETFITELKNRAGDKVECRKGYLESAGKQEEAAAG